MPALIKRRQCVVGVPQVHYSVDRNILASTPAWCSVIRPRDLRRLMLSCAGRLHIALPRDLAFYFAEPFFPRVDLIHAFNAVCATKVPWISTFESSLPRYRDSASSRARRQGHRLMLSRNCRALVALSEATRNLAVRDWSACVTSSERDALLQKTIVLHPPQPVVTEFVDKPSGREPHFVFIGRDFYRKGGLESLEALGRLADRGVMEWRATFVGDLDSFGDYASRTGRADRERAMSLLSKLSKNVRHFHHHSMFEVNALLRQADFYLLPTLADTYGYSVLEAQAHGAVCITTNVRSLPELVSEHTGICIPLPLDEDRNAHTNRAFAAIRRRLVDELVDGLTECIVMPRDRRRSMAEAAAKQLRSQHAPQKHQEVLASVYNQAIEL
jgi:glycosyltransferase involved in cell wall biosynthesis